MFDGLLGGKFYNKCKYAIKCIGSRLGPIRNKKNAMLRFLRKDVADLLAHGHDENALGRMDALIMEMNRASCYDMIEQYCQCILQWLSVLQKQRECPQEAVVSVSTLIFAAARFPDLPELCDLRRVFTDRYGNKVESSVHAEFMGKIQRKSFPLDQKLRVMHEIAGEYSITWDPKKFIKKSDTHIVQPEKINKGSAITDQNDEKKVPNHGPIGLRQEVLFEGRCEYIYADTNQKKDLQNEPKDIHVIPSTNNTRAHETSRRTKKVFTDETENVEPSIFVTRHTPSINSENRIHELQVDEHANKSTTRDEDSNMDNGQQKQMYMPVESEAHKASYRIPPYTKSKASMNMKHTKHQFCEEEKVPAMGERPSQSYGGKESDITTPSVKSRLVSKPSIPHLSSPDPNSAFTGNERSNDNGAKHSHIEKTSNILPPYVKPKVNGKKHTEEQLCEEVKVPVIGERPSHSYGGKESDIITPNVKARAISTPTIPSLPAYTSIPGPIVDDSGYVNGTEGDKPRPRSVRKKHTRTPAANDVDTTGDNPTMTLNGRQKQSSKHLQDEEYNKQKVVKAGKVPAVEEVDNAIYYGKLLSETLDATKRRQVDGRNAANYDGGDEEEMMDRLLIHYSKKGAASGNLSVKENPRYPPGRAVSVPLEPVSPVEAVKGPARAASMQPDLFSPKMGRVHPNLPDCDELAARVSALRKA